MGFVEGVALAVIGLVGFVAVKKPLSSLGRVPDIDSLYNPGALYGTRAVVVGVTELYAAADRVAVRTADLAGTVVSDPQTALGTVTDEGRPRLQAGIGTSVVLVIVVLVGVLALLVL